MKYKLMDGRRVKCFVCGEEDFDSSEYPSSDEEIYCRYCGYKLIFKQDSLCKVNNSGKNNV